MESSGMAESFQICRGMCEGSRLRGSIQGARVDFTQARVAYKINPIAVGYIHNIISNLRVQPVGRSYPRRQSYVSMHGRNAEASIQGGDHHRFMKKRGHSFLIRLPVHPPLPIVDLPREIAESPGTSFMFSRRSME